ncbi:MAG: [FeFe] hydrogenase H-cluster maturation GTPase HydF [Ignavibacteria bacterium]|nr:[FeFe] hydrogenase H-cluster maturation GTPase HydF [Ignavibacteria bacterium]MBT8383364.1 [FeFe] hydrogenase H-cluster maturation GTPase HydF [Ignavibacteria bacterium]MBT8390390.1 [FeFe] hydrogenase H-cluster maturation GTPase HydF [Ignavibacteria bacterium]NNJ52740.1 [FeFe] hydrogenase H-cluster maturation GTPase HydF [Ignavibacteriaceae bacterium]NNL21635.1 [FeFe] hydrogenase H-cluster maturation GTPase HydF [Ignavibacteriaceae bacterium]
MNQVAKAERAHIAIVGKRNVGKSSLINSLTNQELSIVSEVAGTTTDPVSKAVELLPYGPIVIVDTAGIDDIGDLGQKRIGRTIKSLSSADFAILVLDATEQIDNCEVELIMHIKKIGVQLIAVVNKIELGTNPTLLDELRALEVIHFEVSCKESVGINSLKRNLIQLLPADVEYPLIDDLVGVGDVVVMVVPIDLGAPKGRIIKPQVQAIREALDENTICIVVKDSELKSALGKLKSPPDLVITDSQAIMRVAKDVPKNIKLTTFSILMARQKGDLTELVKSLKIVDELKEGDKVLIAEACTHHAQKDDIGTVKIPHWLKMHTQKELIIDVKHGLDFPENLSEYKLIVHCGACMFTRKTMNVRIKQAKIMDVPIVNYGMLISYMHGAIPRVLKPFPGAYTEWHNSSLTEV